MKFPKPALFLSVLFLVIGCNGNAFSQSEKWTGTCDITFSGSSTLHNFSGSVKAEPFSISITDLGDKAKATATGSVTVKTSKMVTGNKKRDSKMYVSLATKTFPNVTVEILNLMVSDTKPVAGDLVPRPTIIPFTMTLKGKKQKMVGKVSDWSYSDGAISYTIAFPVSLKASGIDVPAVLGVVKVADTIQIEAKLKLKRK